MRKVMTLQRLDEKETKHCYRYGLLHGDICVTTVYVQKESVKGSPPLNITVTVEGAD